MCLGFFNKLYLLNLLFPSLEGIKEYFLIYFYECVLPACMCVCTPRGRLVPMESEKGAGSPGR